MRFEFRVGYALLVEVLFYGHSEFEDVWRESFANGVEEVHVQSAFVYLFFRVSHVLEVVSLECFVFSYGFLACFLCRVSIPVGTVL